MRKAMGVAVFAGMIGVTAFGLFLTPVFYVLLRRLAGNRPLKLHGEVPHGEDFVSADHPATPSLGGSGGGGLHPMPASPPKNLVKPFRTALLPLMAALVLAGCATVPSGLPEIQTTAQFKEQGKDQGATPPAGFTRAVPSESQPRGAWWLAFNDPTLN
eukprot:gene47035-63736_t